MITNKIPFGTLGIDTPGDAHGTAGPWEYDRRSSAVKSTLPRTGMRPAGDFFPLVCRLASSYTTNIVDGYLIAAAPELLAACEELMRCIDAGYARIKNGEISDEETEVAAKNVRAAIAKAKAK